MNIGIFDSGLGGLWILKTLREELPQYNYVFFADQANVPYGTKTTKELFECTTKVLHYLFTEKNCACVIMACNTTSSAIYSELKLWVEKEYPGRKIFGIVHPTVLAIPIQQPIAIFATPRTVDSHAFKNEIAGIVTEVALPELVSRIEYAGETTEYIASFTIPDTIRTGVLCCTHYGIVREDFIKAFPQITRWISQEEIIPEFFKKYLDANPDFEKQLSKDQKLEIYVSKQSEVFDAWLAKWYGDDIHSTLVSF